MSFSNRTTRPHPLKAALAALVTLQLGAILLSGCAHARSGRPEPPRAPAREAAHAGNLDPSEEITSRELSSIPDPVPTGSRSTAVPNGAGVPPAPIEAAPKAAPEPSGAGSAAERFLTPPPAQSAPGGDSASVAKEPVLPPPTPIGPWVWRVQILATPDRALAERIAREAADRLGTTTRIDSEPPLFKVRLGAFGSEADAQVLKGRAVEMGYPGAFRVKIRAVATDE